MNDIDEILARHLAGENLPKAEKQLLETYRATNGEEYARLENTLGKMEKDYQSMGFDAEAAWHKVLPRLQKARKVRIRPLYVALAVAASLLLLIGIGLPLPRGLQADSAQLYTNATAVEQAKILPDGSRLTLYPNASVEYSEDAGTHERRVWLQGKARFDVVRQDGHAFVVSGTGLNVEVLGTIFTVDLTDSTAKSVQVESGRVRVDNGTHETILKEGECVKVMAQGMQKQQVSLATQKKPQTLTFRDTPVREAARLIGRAMDIRIEVAPTLASNRITTQMTLTRPMDAVRELALLCNCRADSLSPLVYQLK